jgi:hypothetical protein
MAGLKTSQPSPAQPSLGRVQARGGGVTPGGAVRPLEGRCGPWRGGVAPGGERTAGWRLEVTAPGGKEDLL